MNVMICCCGNCRMNMLNNVAKRDKAAVVNVTTSTIKWSNGSSTKVLLENDDPHRLKGLELSGVDTCGNVNKAGKMYLVAVSRVRP